MKSNTKIRLMSAFSFLCLIGFAAQSVQLWRTNDRLTELTPAGREIPESIEQKILAEMDKKDLPTRISPGLPMGSPFGSLSQVQQYMDSVFGRFNRPAMPSSNFFGSTGMSFTKALPEIALDETEKEYSILIPVDSGQEIELSTSIENNSVSVSGLIKENLQQSQNGFSSSFHSQRQFAKTIDLPVPIDEFGLLTQQTEDGIRISIPKKSS
ncbi:MAG: hypothetical protein DHS20C12_10040 [Pseudohongiella sp.]|nr:MAG: hypothetical protein DHS20C12_10040 [Pseudohongiella sp.]